MDASVFVAFQRASEMLSADNQATIDWADDSEFRLAVTRRELNDAVDLMSRGALPIRVWMELRRLGQRRQ